MLIGRTSAPGRCYIDTCLHRGHFLTPATTTTSPQPTHPTSNLSADSQKIAEPDGHIRALAFRACKTDDTALLKEAFWSIEIDFGTFLTICKRHGRSRSLRCSDCLDDIKDAQKKAFKTFQQDILRQALNNNSMSIIIHLLEHGFRVPGQFLLELISNNSLSALSLLIACGVSVQKLPPWELGVDCSNASETTLKFLLAHGCDINYRHVEVHQDMNRADREHSKEAEPYMWRVVKNHARVKWGLEHGASIHPRDFQTHKEGGVTPDQYFCEPILEVAARRASVATFELLHSHGAPLGRRTLHRAVEFECMGQPPHYARMRPTDRQVSSEPWNYRPYKKEYDKWHEWQNRMRNRTKNSTWSRTRRERRKNASRELMKLLSETTRSVWPCYDISSTSSGWT